MENLPSDLQVFLSYLLVALVGHCAKMQIIRRVLRGKKKSSEKEMCCFGWLH